MPEGGYMIEDRRRIELRHAALSTWQTMHRDLLNRAARAHEQSAQAIIRADAAIQRALQMIERANRHAVGSVRPAHVVIAEDNHTHRSPLMQAVRADERTQLAAEAVDGPEALAAAIVHQPDIVILDDQLAFLRGRAVAVRSR